MPTVGALPSGVGEFAFYEPRHRVDQFDHRIAVQAIRFVVGQLFPGSWPALRLYPVGKI